MFRLVMLTGGQFTGKWGYITGEKLVKPDCTLLGVKLRKRNLLVFVKPSQIWRYDDLLVK